MTEYQLKQLANRYFRFIQKYEKFLQKYGRSCFYQNKLPVEDVKDYFSDSYYPWYHITKHKKIEESDLCKEFRNSSSIKKYMKFYDEFIDTFFNAFAHEVQDYFAKNKVLKSAEEIDETLKTYFLESKLPKNIFSDESAEEYEFVKELSSIEDDMQLFYKNNF